jgi:hypothetical protein
MRLATLIEIKQGNFHRFALVNVKWWVRPAFNIAAAAKKRVIKVARCEIRFAVSSNLGATYQSEGANGGVRSEHGNCAGECNRGYQYSKNRFFL